LATDFQAANVGSKALLKSARNSRKGERRMRAVIATLSSALAAIPFEAALAGPVQPFDNLEPSLVVNELMTPTGIFPPHDGSGPAEGDTLGFVYDFAGPLAPTGTFAAQGQTLPISSYVATFSLLGTTYGGNGMSTFALPNLEGAATIGAGSGPGLTPRTLGAAVGSPTVTLTSSQVPTPHQNSAAQPYDTMQPSLPLTPLIAISGVYPSRGGGSGTAAFIGQIAWTAANYAPAGWLPADGQILSIAQNQALFSLLGNIYGGNGLTTFALPDLEGRIAIGADGANPLGSEKGAETYTVNRSELPGPGQKPLDNDQPSLAINYIIAISGIYPSLDGDPFNANTPVLGQIAAFASNFAPSGWALADGQLLSIAENPALFSVIGTTYGGNGVTDFALPDLDGRTIIGAGGGFSAGETLGADNIFLSADNLPPAASVPEPAPWVMMTVGFAVVGFAFRLRRQMRPA
jgi:microcystin-dependent protein